MTPPAPMIGSAKNAATVSAPSRSIIASRLSAIRVEDIGDRQVEVAVIVRQAGEARGRDRDAVVALVTRDQLFLFRPADGVVVVPDDLDGGVVRLGAGIVEKYLRHRHGQQLEHALGQVDGGLMTLAVEDMVVGETLHLRLGGVDQPLLAIAQRDAPKAGETLDIFLAGIVPDAHALTARHDERTVRLMLREIGVGMKLKGDVAGFRGVGAQHGGSRWLWRYYPPCRHPRSNGGPGQGVAGE